MEIKTYYNNGIIGNSKILGCLTDKGELIRLYWPNIDYQQLIDKFNCGIFFTDKKQDTNWLNDDKWKTEQRYIKDTNILMTCFFNENISLKIEQIDFVVPDEDIVIRHYKIENGSLDKLNLGYMLYSSFITNNQDIRGTLFDFENEALVHYWHNFYVSISADRDVFKFQIGNNVSDAANLNNLHGTDSIGMIHDGAVSWNLGEVLTGETESFTLYICMSQNLNSLKKLICRTRKTGWYCKYQLTEEYWKKFLRNAKNLDIGVPVIEDLYRRSLLIFKLMQNEKSGGLLAAPEVDENFTRCGRYGYCWGRDGVFIAEALDCCGLSDMVDRFYEWVINTQDQEGFWHQRYYSDGNMAPSWGIQIDETGSLIWGILQHYRRIKNRDFLENMWLCVEKGVEFLVSFIDKETGLPNRSYDLWEERIGEHAYSSAAVYGGIVAGANIAKILGQTKKIIDNWEEAASKIKEAIERMLWREGQGRYFRSIRTKLNPWGNEYTDDKIFIQINSKGDYRDFTLEDPVIDVSLLGLCIPFGVFNTDSPRIESTVKVMEHALVSPVIWGFTRYENDNYIGGNPWVIATLWFALYYIDRKNFTEAWKCLMWATEGRTELGFLPEQRDKHTGAPAWVTPLTWSHAMFVLVAEKMANLKGEGFFE